MENKLQEFNSRSDFKLKVNLLNNGNVINPRDLKWTIAHYIVTSKKVIASYDGTTLTNCEINGNDIICVFDNHNLGVGRLMREVILYIEDDAMPDGIRKEVKISTTNYRLTNTPCTKCEPVEITDNIDFSVTGTPGKDAYEVWLTLPGNEGKTKEEFFDSFKGTDGDHITIENKNFYINGNDTGIKADYSVEFAEIREIAEGIDGKIVQTFGLNTDKIPSQLAVAKTIPIINVTTLFPLPIGEFYNGETAKNVIPTSLRSPGRSIIYLLADKTWRTETFIATDISLWNIPTYWRSPEEEAIAKNTFREIAFDVNSKLFTIDYELSPHGIIDLHSLIPNLSYLDIVNVPNNAEGSILVKQSGNKVLVPNAEFKQEIELPLQGNKVSIINYKKIQNILYLSQEKIISDVVYEGPAPILDLSLESFDGKNTVLKWTEPLSGLVESPAIDLYEIRYAHSPITNQIGWLSAMPIKIPSLTVVGANIENTCSFSLKEGNVYFIYVKTLKKYRGAYYQSPVSNPIRVTTKSFDDATVENPKIVPLSAKQAVCKVNKYEFVNGIRMDLRFMFNKSYTKLHSSELPDITKAPTGDYKWIPEKYSEASLPYYVTFDLGGPVEINSVYLYSGEKIKVSVYGAKSSTSPWVYLGILNINYNAWANLSVLSFEDKTYSFLRIAWEEHVYAANNPVPDGTPCWSTSKEFEGLSSISFFGVFGNPISKLSRISLTPVRDFSRKHTIGDAFNTNGHFYQDGRIHSMVGGTYVRLFGSFGHFSGDSTKAHEYVQGPEAYALMKYKTLAEFKFRLNDLSWVTGNSSSTDLTLTELLRKTYKPFGLKPILTASSLHPAVVRRRWSENKNTKIWAWYPIDKQYSKLIDQNYFQFQNPPSPVKGVNGIAPLFAYSFNPENYKIITKLCYAMAGRYGNNKLSSAVEATFPVATDTSIRETLETGLDLISGIEPGNEMQGTWKGFEGWMQPEESAAYLSAIYDGNKNRLLSNDDSRILGIKEVCPDMMVVHPGLVGMDAFYFANENFHARRLRGSNESPYDIYNVHGYSSTAGIDQSSSSATILRGLPYEGQPILRQYLREMVEYRNRYDSSKEIWITEFGYGEAGKYDSASTYAAYSLPGKILNGQRIPDLHRSDVKAAWTIRAFLFSLNEGINAMHYYSTESEYNWFGQGEYDGGAGYEMWEWDKLPEGEPGSKVTLTNQYMIPWARGGFKAMGLFGHVLANGGYPVSRATWRIMTFRNRLKDYYFLGFKYLSEYPDIRIACFSHKIENKSALVVYKESSNNDGYTNVSISMNNNNSNVKDIMYYIPKLPNPKDVPYSYSFGLDKNRTGLPTSTRVYDEDGKVVSAVFPTIEENPYFPIVGPIGSKSVESYFPGKAMGQNNIESQHYVEADTKKIVRVQEGPYRQLNAICDYIEFHPEGIKGANGIEILLPIVDNTLTLSLVTEMPRILLFDGDYIEPDYLGTIENVTTIAINATSIKVYWENTSAKDESYDIYLSTMANSGYILTKNVVAGLINETLLDNLVPDTTYFVKVLGRYKSKTTPLSEYSSVRTHAIINTPIITSVVSLGMTELGVYFDSTYSAPDTTDFMFYEIERKAEDGTSSIIKIENKTTTSFIDSNLLIGKRYAYRVRVVLYSGISSWSNLLENRTLVPEEASPSIISGYTDKISNYIYLEFNLLLDKGILEDIKNKFSLVEGGNSRIIINAKIHESINNMVVLQYYPDTISTFDKNIPLLLSYNKTGLGMNLKSIYGVEVSSFQNYSLKNNFGNYTNLIHTYKINFAQLGSTPVNTDWNNVIPSSNSLVTKVLKDEFGFQSKVLLSILTGSNTTNGVTKRWSFGPNSDLSGKYLSTQFIVPEEVFKSYGNVAYHADSTKKNFSWFTLTELSNSNRYTLHFYCSKSSYGTQAAFSSIEVNNISSGLFNYINNTDKFVVFNDVIPVNGKIEIKYYNENASMGAGCPINFIILQEFEDSSAPDLNTVYINNVVLLNSVS